ncbi:MAG TPA: hypothetical protein VGI85_06825 [Chthoniobacterales bacterium]
MTRSFGFALGIWIAFFALYLMCAAQLSSAELCLGAIVAATATAFLLVVRHHSSHHFRMNARWLGRLRAVPLQMLIDGMIVFRAILRRPALARGSGRFQAREFHAGNEHPAARTRRALVTIGISCAPNTFVLGTTETEEQLLVHQLAPKPPEKPGDPEWPL